VKMSIFWSARAHNNILYLTRCSESTLPDMVEEDTLESSLVEFYDSEDGEGVGEANLETLVMDNITLSGFRTYQ
jgi:hypothetical protein